jgi:hypothetical protein
VAKIPPSPFRVPPNTARPIQKPPRNRLRTKEQTLEEKEFHEMEGGVDGGGPTMGELLSKEKDLAREFANERHGLAPWEDEHHEAEDRLRKDEQRSKEERVHKKDDSRSAKDERPNTAGSRAAARPGAQRKPDGPQAALAAKLAPRASDGFELGTPALQKTQATVGPSLSGAPPAGPIPPSRMGTGAIHVLNSAQDPGVYFREHGQDGGAADEEDEELAAAVEEAIRLLHGVRGIHRIGAGSDEAGEPVVLITVTRGFGQSAMRRVPEQVHRFRTLVALPYELLPLRRDAL